MPSRTEKTPFGDITMTSDGVAITGITWADEGAGDSHANDGSDAILDEGFRQLGEYALGKRQEFDVPVSFDKCSDKQRRWLEILRQVPYGTTISYAELAEKAGFSSKSALAAGSACAKNHLPIIFPCHRVLKNDGTLGNFGGHKSLKPNHSRNLSIKKRLINHEKDAKKNSLADTKEEPQSKSSSIAWGPLAVVGGGLALLWLWSRKS